MSCILVKNFINWYRRVEIYGFDLFFGGIASFINASYILFWNNSYPNPVRSIDDNKLWDIVLRSEELLQHPTEWDQVSKDFIRSCGSEINLNKIFSEYTNMVKAFHEWLYPILQQYHQKDFEDQKKLEQQLNISTDELKSKLSPFFQ